MKLHGHQDQDNNISGDLIFLFSVTDKQNNLNPLRLSFLAF